jgi:hypothetical protein
MRLNLPRNGSAVELPAQRNIQFLYRRIRNLLRQYSVQPVVETSLQIIWKSQRARDRFEWVGAAPWHIALLVKWCLEDEAVQMRGGSAVPEKFLDFLRQSLWTHAGTFSGEQVSAHAMARSYLHVQMAYQRHQHTSFLRWPALISAQPENSILRRQFRHVIGMEPESFIDLTLALKIALVDNPAGLSRSAFVTLTGGDEEAGQALRKLFVRTLDELRLELRQDSKQPLRSELVEFSYFIRYPILDLDGHYLFWDSVVAEKAFEHAVHLRMSDLKGEYSQKFGRAFEDYVVSLLSEAGLSPVTDEAFKRMVGPSKNAEAVVPLLGVNLIVEAKMGLFPDTMILKEDSRFLYEKFAPLRTAMRQGFDVSQKIRAHDVTFKDLRDATEDFLLIVTSRDLLISGGPMLQELMRPEGGLEYFDDSTYLPLKNTFIVDIQGFECFCMAVKEGRVDPVHLLQHAAVGNAQVGQGRYYFEQWLRPDQQPHKDPHLLDAAFESAMDRMASKASSFIHSQAVSHL